MFEVGDEVEAFGCLGLVVDIQGPLVKATFCKHNYWFTFDGKSFDWAKEPSLKLIKKKKKKVKKKVKGYMSDKMIGVSDGYLLWLSKDKIQYNIPCIEIEFEIEVEE